MSVEQLCKRCERLCRALAPKDLAGVPLYGILEAATINAARCLGKDGEFGTVTPGKRADLLLLDTDPRRDLAKREGIAGVMTRGRWLPRATLAAALDRLGTG